MPRDQGIITPVLKYWGLYDHPFDDFILQGDSLAFFVDRKEELHALHNSLTVRLCGIYGTQGVGKSSFLRMFQRIIGESGISVVYVHLMGTNEKALFREILRALLDSIIAGDVKTDPKLKVNAKTELSRLEHSIRVSRETELGAQSVLKAGIRRVQEQKTEPHTEESAQVLISQIVRGALKPFILIVDDLERVKHFIEDEDTYFRLITSFARTVDESLTSKMVSFVVSLDNQFVKKVSQNLPDDEGAISFSFGELIELQRFSPQVLVDVMKSRLKARGWKKSVGEFITVDAYLALLVATGGHPRRAFAVLRSAMEYVEVRKKKLVLDADSIIAGINRRKENLNTKDHQIARYLFRARSISTSDDQVLSELSIPRTTLRNRLALLSDRLHLQSEQILSGKAIKVVYTFPEFNLE